MISVIRYTEVAVKPAGYLSLFKHIIIDIHDFGHHRGRCPLVQETNGCLTCSTWVHCIDTGVHLHSRRDTKTRDPLANLGVYILGSSIPACEQYEIDADTLHFSNDKTCVFSSGTGIAYWNRYSWFDPYCASFKLTHVPTSGY